MVELYHIATKLSMEPQPGIKPEPTVYETVVLSLNYCGMEPERGIEPRHTLYKRVALPLCYTGKCPTV